MADNIVLPKGATLIDSKPQANDIQLPKGATLLDSKSNTPTTSVEDTSALKPVNIDINDSKPTPSTDGYITDSHGLIIGKKPTPSTESQTNPLFNFTGNIVKAVGEGLSAIGKGLDSVVESAKNIPDAFGNFVGSNIGDIVSGKTMQNQSEPEVPSEIAKKIKEEKKEYNPTVEGSVAQYQKENAEYNDPSNPKFAENHSIDKVVQRGLNNYNAVNDLNKVLNNSTDTTLTMNDLGSFGFAPAPIKYANPKYDGVNPNEPAIIQDPNGKTTMQQVNNPDPEVVKDITSKKTLQANNQIGDLEYQKSQLSKQLAPRSANFDPQASSKIAAIDGKIKTINDALEKFNQFADRAYTPTQLSGQVEGNTLSNYFVGKNISNPDAIKTAQNSLKQFEILNNTSSEELKKHYDTLGAQRMHIGNTDEADKYIQALSTPGDFWGFSGTVGKESYTYNGVMPEIMSIQSSIDADKKAVESLKADFTTHYSDSAIKNLQKQGKTLSSEGKADMLANQQAIDLYQKSIEAKQKYQDKLSALVNTDAKNYQDYLGNQAYLNKMMEDHPIWSTLAAIGKSIPDMGYDMYKSSALIANKITAKSDQNEFSNASKVFAPREYEQLPQLQYHGEFRDIGSIPLQLYDKEGKWNPEGDWYSAGYSTGKMLGFLGGLYLTGGASEGFSELALGENLTKTLGEYGASSATKLGAQIPYYGVKAANIAITKGIGNVMPMIMMGLPDAMKTEMEFNNQSPTGALYTSIARQTAMALAFTAFNPQKWLPKMLVGMSPEDVGELGADESFKRAVVESMDKYNVKWSDRLHNAVFNGAPELVKGFGIAAGKMTVQTELNEFVQSGIDNIIQQQKPDYKSTADVSVGGAMNRFVQTVITMLPALGAEAINHTNLEKFADAGARYNVAKNPDLYKQTVDEQVKNNEIPKEEADRRKSVIDGLSATYRGIQAEFSIIDKKKTLIDPITKKDISVTEVERESMKKTLFDNAHKQADLLDQLSKTTDEKQKTRINEQLEKVGDEKIKILSEISDKLNASVEDRIKFQDIIRNSNFDHLYDEKSLDRITTLAEASKVKGEIDGYIQNERNPELIQKYKDYREKIYAKFPDLKAPENIPQEGEIHVDVAGREPFNLKLNHSYYIRNSIEESVEGSKIFPKQEFKIVSDLGEGHLQVAYPDGTTGELTTEQIAKFDLYSKDVVDGWRKKDSKGKQDPRAFVFDNINDVFSYSFAKETADRAKEPKGRIKYDKEEGVIKFVYKDKKGNTREQTISSSDFNSDKGKLKRVRTLETQEQFDERERAYQEEIRNTDLAKLDLQANRRNALFEDFVKNEAKSLIKTHEKDIKSLNKKIEKLRNTIAGIKSVINLKDTSEFLKGIKKQFSKEELNSIFGGVKVETLGQTVLKYYTLKALDAKVESASADLATLENTLKERTDARDQIISDLGSQFEEITSRTYNSDEKLTDQVTAYNNSLKEQFERNTEVLEGLKNVIESTKAAIISFGNRIKSLVASYEGLSGKTIEEQDEETPKTNAEFRQVLSEAEDKFAALSGENDKLAGEISKLDKVQKFLEKQEKKFDADKAKMKLQKTKDDIYNSQHGKDGELQDKHGTGNPDEDSINNGLKTSNNIDLEHLFEATTSKEDKNEKGELVHPAILRLQTFLNNVRDIADNFKLLVITKDNAERYGLKDIIFTDKDTPNTGDNQEHNDIKVVFIKKELKDGKPVFVDKEGKEISPTADDIVFTSIRKANLNWSDGRVNYHIDGLTGEPTEENKKEAELRRDAHITFRDALIEVSKGEEGHTLDITGVSRGIENQHSETPQPVVGNIIPTTVDISKEQVVHLPILEKPDSLTGQIQFNGRNINMPIGRAVFKFGQSLLFGFNRKLGTQDAIRIGKIFKYVYDKAKKEAGEGKIPKIDENVINYLKKVVYWRNPEYISKTTGKPQDKATIGRNQIWYDSKDNSLHIGSNDFKIPFQFEPNDKSNLDELERVFTPSDNSQSIYHNIDAKGMMEPFTEIVGVDKKGNLQLRNWTTYQEYLISSKYPDGTTRPIEEIPLTTNLSPSTENAPNITGRYVTYPHPTNESVLRTTPLESSNTESVGKEYTITRTNNGNKRHITFDEEGNIKHWNLAGNPTKEAVRTVLNDFNTEAAKNKKEGISDLDLFKQEVENQGWVFSEKEGKAKPTTKVVEKTEEPSTGTTAFKPETSVETFVSPSSPAVTPVDLADNTSSPTSVMPEKSISDLLAGFKNSGIPPASDDGANYRLSQSRLYKMENLMEAKKWFQDRFPNVDFNVLAGLIHGKAWGLFSGKMVTLSNLAEEGTIYHEAFEAVYGLFLGNRGQKALHQEFKLREGTFTDYETGKEIKYSEATNHQIKEQLAEEYRELQLTGSKFEGSSVKAGLFRRMFNFIQNLVLGKPDTIQEVFDKITNAAYKDKIPNLDLNNVQSGYRLADVKKSNPVFFNDVMKSITNLLFDRLQRDGRSIPEILTSSYNIAKEYKTAKSEIDNFYGGKELLSKFSSFDKESFIALMSKQENFNLLMIPKFAKNWERFINEKGLNTKQALEKYYDVLKGYEFIDKHWDEITKSHMDFLSKYNIEFKNNGGDELVKDEESNQGDIVDALKLSRKYNANTEVKLLIATLREQEYKETVTNKVLGTTKREPVSKLNSMLMSNLVDYNNTINNLLHKLVGTTNFDEVAAVLNREKLLNASLLPLIDKLKLETPANQLSKYDVDLRNKFYQSMSNMKAETEKLSVDPDNLTGSLINLNEQNANRLIKDEWLMSLANSPIITKGKNQELELDKKNLKTKRIDNIADAQGFLKELGFKFNIDPKLMQSKDRDAFLKAVSDFYKTIHSTSPDTLLYENAETRNSLNSLAELYVKYSGDYSEPQHLNIEREAVQNVILHNSYGMRVKLFNSINTLDELFNRSRQLNPDNKGNAYQKYSQILKRGGLFFNMDGERRKELAVTLLDGSEVKETIGTPTSKLHLTDKIAQEIAANLEGIFTILVPAEKKSEWGITFGELATKLQANDEKYVIDKMKDYLRAEILAVQQFQTDGSNLKALNKSVDGVKVGEQLRIFKDVLKGITLEITPERDVEDIIKFREKDIDKAIADFIDEKVNNTYNYLKENGAIIPYKAEKKEGTATTAFKPEQEVEEQEMEEQPKYTLAFSSKFHNGEGLTEQEVKDLIRYADVNNIFAMNEQFKLFWGDPAQWEQITKRIGSFTSPRKLSISDAKYFNDWHNEFSNKLSFTDKDGNIQSIALEEGDFGYTIYDDLIRTQTMKDVKIVSAHIDQITEITHNQKALDLFNKSYKELDEKEKAKVDGQVESAEYEKVNEADAQAWSPLVGYRQIRQRDSNWTDAEEEVFNWDNALARWEISNGKDYTTGEKRNFQQDLYPKGDRGELLKAHDEALLKKGNPFINRAKEGLTLPVFNILKPIYAGLKEGETMTSNLDKMSIAPITWRALKGTNSEQFYVEHLKNGTSYLKVESAQKIGETLDTQPLYNEKGEVNTNVKHEFLNYRDFGIQVETSKQKDESPMGTQLTKQATLNMVDGGVPKDFIKSNPEGAKDKWNALSEKEKLASSENYRHIRANNTLLATLKEKAKDKIFKDFGVSIHTDEDGQKSYKFNSLQKMQDLIQRELKNRDVPENIKDYARINPNNLKEEAFYLPFDLIIGSDKIESLFTSIIDKNVLRPKINGGQMPQIASTLFEKGARNFVYKNAEGKWSKVDSLESLSPEEKSTVKMTSNHLKFYEMTKDSKKINACEIMIPNFFKEYFKQGKEIDFKDVPKELLEGIGFRIPTQGLNSIEHFVIKGFLPSEYGDSVMVPSEITTKAGSDFDIDKLNIYLHNYRMKNGSPEKIKYLNEDNSTSKERFEILHRGNTRALARLDMIISKDYEKNVLFNETDPVTDKLWTAIFGKYNESTFEYNNDEVDELLKEQGSSLAAYNKIKEASIQEKLDHPESAIPDFEKLPMEMQNTKKAVENQYIDNLRGILSLPENYSQLVEPNSAKVLKDNAKDINSLYGKEDKSNSFSTFLDRVEVAKIRNAFQQGNDAVGIGASALSQHGLAQVVGLEFNTPYETTLDKTFNFDTNSEVKDGKLFYNLASANGKDGRSISSTIAAFLNAFVDISKDPFIFDINGNYNTAGYYLTGVRLGIPIDTLVRWMNQPIIREYTNELSKRNSILTKATGIKEYPSEIAARLKNKYGVGEEVERAGNYTDSELNGFIEHFVKKQNGDIKDYSREFSDNQGNLLDEFIKLQSLSWELFRYGQAVGQDTKRTTSLDEIRIQFAKIIVGLNGQFGEYVNKTFEQTFVGNIVNAKYEYLKSLEQFYITESPKAREILNPILNSLFNSGMKADVIEKAAGDMRKQFLTYLLHTIPFSIQEGKQEEILTASIVPLFKGDENIAVRLRKLQKAIESNSESKPDDNYFVKNLMGILPLVMKDADIANLRMLKKTGDKFENDLLTGDFSNLKNNKKTEPLYYDLLRAALLQNGLVNSFNSFSNIIPNEDFHRIAEQVFDQFDRIKLEALTNFKNSYYENSWKNTNIVPFTKALTKDGNSRIKTPGIDPLTGKDRFSWGSIYDPYNKRRESLVGDIPMMSVFVGSSDKNNKAKTAKDAKNAYMTTKDLKRDPTGTPLYSKREREVMKKKGDFSYQTTTLWKRLEVYNPKTKEMDSPLVKHSFPEGDTFLALFYPVNKKGSGVNLMEHYPTRSFSAINEKTPLINGETLYKLLGREDVNQMSDMWLNQFYSPKANEGKSLDISLLTDRRDGNEENGIIPENSSADEVGKIVANHSLSLFEGKEKEKPIEPPKKEAEPLPKFEGKEGDPLTKKDCA